MGMRWWTGIPTSGKKGDYLCRGAWLEKSAGKRNWYTKETYQNHDSRECIINLEKVVSANIDMRPFTTGGGDNPLPRDVSRIIANAKGGWCMSDADYIFLLEETQLQEDNCEYDIGEANTVLEQEREVQQWMNAGQLGKNSDEEAAL